MEKIPEEEQKFIADNLEHREQLENEETAFSCFEKLSEEEKKKAQYVIIHALKDKNPEKVMDWLSVEYADDKLAVKENRDELLQLCSSFQPESRTSASRFKAYLEQLPASQFRENMSTITLLNNSSLGYGFEDILSLTRMSESKNAIDYEVVDYSLYIWERGNNDYEKMRGSFEKLKLSPEQKTQLRKKYAFLSSSEK